MCCFSGTVKDVSQTKIFARFTKDREQAVVYQMNYQADEPLAMILPIPVGSKKEDAVKFVNLEKYPKFFERLHAGFTPPPKSRGGFGGSGFAEPKSILKVEEVGDFVASFVPTVADFDRLDKRFRLPAGTWEQLPQYKDFGFAVFQLKPDAHSVHPMAFTFPTAAADSPLFFPTVHIHDGEVHAKAGFDHTLYLQPRDATQMLPRGWEESPRPAGMFVDTRRAKSLVEADLHCYRLSLRGELKNEDTLVA